MSSINEIQLGGGFETKFVTNDDLELDLLDPTLDFSKLEEEENEDS